MKAQSQYNNLQTRARIRKIARAYVSIYNLDDQIKNEYLIGEKGYMSMIDKAEKGAKLSLAELDKLEKDLIKVLKNI